MILLIKSGEKWEEVVDCVKAFVTFVFEGISNTNHGNV